MTDEPKPDCRVIHLDDHRVWLDEQPPAELDDADIDRHPSAHK